MFEEIFKKILHYFLPKSSYLKKSEIDISYTININICIGI